MKKSGFTLIEVLAVIVIIGIIMIITIPAVSKYIIKSNNSVYAQDTFAYVENVRAKYEMGEYGEYLKTDEMMIVPIRSVVLEKGNEEESPFGKYDFERSYVIIVTENNQYKFYVTIIDETKTGIINVPSNLINEDSVMENIKQEIPTIAQLQQTGSIYRLNGKEYKKFDTREIEGEDVYTEESANVFVFKDSTAAEDPSITNKVTLNNNGATVAGTQTIYEFYAVGWFSDNEAKNKIQTITPPTRNGYSFGGYFTLDNGLGKKIINESGYIVANTSSTFTTSGTLYAKWVECPNGYYSKNSLTCTICPEGYRDGTETNNKISESACLKNVPEGKYVPSQYSVNVASCSANTYSNAHTVTYGSSDGCFACTQLGQGYTKSAGGTGPSGCYMEVPEGRYVSGVKDAQSAPCAANQYSVSHIVFYGEKSQCSLCINLGTNYTKSAGGTGPNGCYMEVAAGKYKTSATGNTTSNCSADKYSLKHNSYYSSADNSCTNCPSGYHSSAGSQSKASCSITCEVNSRVTTADGLCTGSCTGGTIEQHAVSAGSLSPSCTACANTTGVATWGNACTVNTCSAGYYKNGNACTLCPSGQSSGTGTACFATTYNYGYTGGIQTFTAPAKGYYVLEIWGAQGGTVPGGYTGGYGGYSTGVVYLEQNAVLYIGVGGAGSNATSPGQTVPGGYNGGGYVDGNGGVNHINGSGGGATHIATTNRGVLSSYKNYRSEVLIVAGGGGGGRDQPNHEPAARWGYGGSGGGASSAGAYSTAGTTTIAQRNYCIATQTAGAAFGQGEKCYGNSAGGGGYMGGYSGYGACPQYLGTGSGGSGYIGSSQLISRGSITKHMTCYTCTADNNSSTLTVRTTNVSSTATSDYAKSGHGYARITWNGE